MALTYTEAAKLSQGQMSGSIIEAMIVENPIIDRLPFIEVNGKSFTYNTEATLPGVAWRNPTGSYSVTTGTVNQTTEVLRILGGITEVDRFIQQGMSDQFDQLAVQMKALAKAVSSEFNDNFFNGDNATDTEQWDGLKTRLTGSQVITAATNGLPIVGSSDSDIYAFFEKLDELINAVHGSPDALYMNRSVLAKIRSAAMRLKVNMESGLDNFGKKVSMYNGVPMYDIGYKADGTTMILPQTETCGSSSVTSSIYAVKFSTNESEIGVSGLTYGGLQVEKLPRIDTKERGMVELYSGLAVFGGRAAARLKGVLAS